MLESQYEKIIVLLIVLTATILTWKMVKDFYITKMHKVFAHLIAVTTSSFMLFLGIEEYYDRNL